MIRLLLLLALAAIVYFWTRGPAERRRLTSNPWLRTALVSGLALLYLISPIDLIPDVGPVGLIDDVLLLLGTMWWILRQGKPAPDGTARGRGPRARGEQPPRGGDPYEVLGLERNASGAEITRAYREQMKRYHPDRVADLGEELRRLAHKKTLEIQRAYESLRPKRPG